jgi:hypothetical protein
MDCERSSGGSQATRVIRNVRVRKDQKTKDQDALESIVKSLGEEEAANIKMTWDSLNQKGRNVQSDDWGVSNGIIATLLSQNYSFNSIRMLLGCGMSKITRVKEDMQNPNRLAEKKKQIPWHAATKEDLERIKECKKDWALEDGFPCAHRRPREYFVEENVTWKSLHAKYTSRMTDKGFRVLSLTRWMQYVHYFFPGLRLSKSAEDLCDACVSIEMELLSPNLSEETRNELTLKKTVHLDAARSQRRMMNEFIEIFLQQHGSDQSILNPIPELIEDSPVTV